MRLDRHIIRLFVDRVEWVTPRNIHFLLNGRYTSQRILNNGKRDYTGVMIQNELIRMTKTKRIPPLKALPCDGHTAFAQYYTKKHSIGTMIFSHNNKLRDVLAKYLFDRGWRGIDRICLAPPSDATVGTLHFELDAGHMDRRELREKIIRNYTQPGMYQVVFIMASRYGRSPRIRKGVIEHEKNRLNMLFDLARELLPYKPSRVLGASYEQFLETGKVYNFKGQKIVV
jgi:hypothetical protein